MRAWGARDPGSIPGIPTECNFPDCWGKEMAHSAPLARCSHFSAHTQFGCLNKSGQASSPFEKDPVLYPIRRIRGEDFLIYLRSADFLQLSIFSLLTRGGVRKVGSPL